MKRVLGEAPECEQAMLALWREGGVSVPSFLLKYYRRLELSDTETMLLIQLFAFREKEHKDFPTIEEIQTRMSADADTVIRSLQRLLKEGFLQIDDSVDSVTGVQSETYNLDNVWKKLTSLIVADIRMSRSPSATSEFSSDPSAGETAIAAPPSAADVFTMFEQEFARPLTPMEFEMIANWLDRDKYPLELIELALREAVFAGKLRFNYIDRILLEWSRNRVFTAAQAKAYAQQFRGR